MSWVHELTEAYVRVRRFDDAAEIVESVVSPMRRSRVRYCERLQRIAVASSPSHERSTRTSARPCAGMKAGSPFAQARTRLAYGRRLRRARRSPEARTQLELALAAFEQLGARLWAERARSELTQRGRPRSDESPLNLLTVHERRVAALVARGATNKEAAAALFVSPKTVDDHLAGSTASSTCVRVELAALLAAADINA